MIDYKKLKGKTPNELYATAAIAYDDIFTEDNLVAHFNRAVDFLNTEHNLLLPEITEEDLDTPYPSYKYTETQPDAEKYSQTPKIATTAPVDLSYGPWIKLLSVNLNTASKKGYLDAINKLEVLGVNESVIKYKITSKFWLDNSGAFVIDEPEKDLSISQRMFTIEKQEDKDNLVKFAAVEAGGAYELYVKLPKFAAVSIPLVKMLTSKINKDGDFELMFGNTIYTGDVSTIYDLTPVDAFEEVDGVYDIENKQEIFILPTAYANLIFVNYFIKASSYNEAEWEDFYQHDSEYKAGIYDFHRNKKWIFPAELINPKVSSTESSYSQGSSLYKNS